MKRFLFSTFLLLFTVVVTSQKTAKFQWSDLSQWEQEGLQNLNFAFPTDSGFVAYSQEKPKAYYFDEKIYIHQFDTNGKSKVLADFAVPKRFRRETISLPTIEGKDKLYFFSYLALHNDKKNMLLVQVYDHKTATVSEPRELVSIPIKKIHSSGYFQVAISPNKEKIVVLVNDVYVKKTKEKIQIVSFNSDLTLESKNEFTLSFDSKKAYRETLFVDNEGAISIVKKTDFSKKRPVTSVISIKNGELKEQQVSAEKFYISDSQVHTVDGKQYLIGFATDNARPGISVGGAKDNSYFIYNISDTKLVMRKEWDKETIKKVLGKGYIGLKVKDVLFSGEDVFLIGDCYQERRKEVKDKKFVYDYTHVYGPGVAIKMKLTGEVEFEAPLTYRDEYINEQGRLSSMHPFIENGQLYILANERYTKLKKVAIAGYKKIRARIVVLWSFDSEGQLVTTAFEDSGIGGPDDETVFAPRKTLQVSDGKFYVYAFEGRYHRFGNLTLE